MRTNHVLRPVALLASALPLLSLASCAREAHAGDPPSVILICIDTLRADHLGCYGYERNPTSPWMDALAARGVRFADVSSAASWTKPSVPSYLTGTFPLQHGVYLGSSKDEEGTISDVLPEASVTLAEVFQERGYRTAAFVKNAQLRIGQGFEQGFDEYVDEAGDAREIRWRAQDWLQEDRQDRPFFLYLHFFDPHWPYPVPESYARRFTDSELVDVLRDGDWKDVRDRVNDGELEMPAEDVRAMTDLYDGAIRYVDDQLALFWEELERDGLLEDTIVALVSDHGEEFLEHGRIGHGHGLYENLLHVPFLMAGPGIEPAVYEEPASLVDLFPTLLGAAGLSFRHRVEGIDLLRDERAGRPVLAEHLEPGSYRQSLRHGTRKLVRRVRMQEGEREEGGLLASLAPRGRWEVKLGESGAGEPALRLRQREDDDEDELREIEIKGLLEYGADGVARIASLPVLIDTDTPVYGDAVEASGGALEPREGMLVKAVGESLSDGRLVVDKLKLYAAGSEVEHEVRGPLVAVDAEGLRVSLGGYWLGLGTDTELDFERPRHRMDRTDAWSFVEGLEAGDTAGFRVEWRGYDLERDPGEFLPEQGTDPGELAGLLDLLSRKLAGGRIWGEADRSTLSEAELEALRSIGYTE